MLSWALKRSSTAIQDSHASGPDDTQLDLPDTPAPVFALRAFRSALFGTPARKSEHEDTQDATKAKVASMDLKSPTKPAGILLTPGTATTRQKRVSFGNDVKQGSGGKAASASGLPDECPGKFPSPWVDKSDDVDVSRPRTRLNEILERARKGTSQAAGTDSVEMATRPEDADDGWEEMDCESDRDPDVTVDLNEPHSRSGRYWKSYFESYHADAKAEMEKLVKYKQLAKSYARKKDAEATELDQKLKEEQERVAGMEDKVAEMARQIATQGRKSNGEYDSEHLEELAKQTAVALEYKKQVAELESLIQDLGGEPEVTGQQHRRLASPRTKKTLLETQRELRKARAQAKELDKIRNDRDRLRSELAFAEQRAAKLADENKKLAAELSQGNRSYSKIQELETELKAAKEETRQKGRDIGSLQVEHEKLKQDAKLRYIEAREVLEKKNEKIASLQVQIETMRPEAESNWTSRVKTLEGKLQIGEKIDSPGRDNVIGSSHHVDEENTQLVRDLSKLRETSINKGLLKLSSATNPKPPEPDTDENNKPRRLGHESLLSSRPTRGKTDTERKMGPSDVLTDRGNLQTARSPTGGVTKKMSSTPRGSPSRRSVAEPSSRNPMRTSKITSPSSAEKPAESLWTTTSRLRPSERTAKMLPPPPNINQGARIDLCRDNFARLGASDGQGSLLWTIDASKTSMPIDRRAAAIARLEHKRAERVLRAKASAGGEEESGEKENRER